MTNNQNINILEQITFIEEYTNKEPCITTNMYLLKDNMTNNEINHVLMLKQLFEIINNYAKKNYIYPTKTKQGIYYLIEYNNIGYNIGHFLKESSNTYFCIKTTLNQQKNYISINNIIENKPLPKTLQIKQELLELSELIHKLSEQNIPLEAIETETKNTIKKLKKQQSNKSTLYK